ncbi:LytTR family DNA-binding domain-containing protein [Phocaeicola sp.]|uniref:LytR/AlgR family response regulator transcription factor n=1 Tax=Phocaeicola sp. TaxID=2773926 RepID=UPI0023D6A4A0|nr:LytTR family DNA-binding domain-containing protein [Phocaeicola sp.]MDE5677087.1 LytTR family DNA-binding domain-containing protein [Phocaeicola sp.]
MIRCIAIDDEPIALGIIRRYCEQRGGVELETYSAPRLGMQRVSEWKPDIVFLDIEMNGTSGIELARQLPASCCLIFTTAYAHYALEGFEVNAVDFLHKPYFYERFDRAMQKAEQWLRMHDLLRVSESSVRQLLLKSEYKNVAVSMDTIIYIESIDNYIKVHLTDGTSVLSKIPLRSIEEQLPSDEFLRIHRSFVVARRRIAGFTRSEVRLEKECGTLPVGKKYVEAVRRLICR